MHNEDFLNALLVCLFVFYGVYGYLLSLDDHTRPHEPEDVFLATFNCKQDIHPQEDCDPLDMEKSLKQVDSQ